MQYEYENKCLENGEKLFLNSEYADVYFLFPFGKSVPANRAILSADSDVFDKMFFGTLSEPGNVRIEDASVAEFTEFLQYFYLSICTLTTKNVGGVFDLGEKYQVARCVRDCSHFLIHTVNNENVCYYSELAITYNKQPLIKELQKHVVVHAEHVFKTVGFLKCSKKVLHGILKLDVLPCGEVAVFEACMEWVKFKSGQTFLTKEVVDMHLGDLYNDIRFASIGMKAFVSLEEKYESVLKDDFKRITRIILDGKPTRNAGWKPESVFEFDRTLTSETYERQQFNGFQLASFSLSIPLLLGEITCVEMYCVGSEDNLDAYNLRVPVEISERANTPDAETKILLDTDVDLDSDGTEITLPHPVLTRPGYTYTISFGAFPAFHGFVASPMRMYAEAGNGNIRFETGSTQFVSALGFNEIN